MSAARPDTWMPLYVADYLADTGHLSTRQHGAYLLLIMHYWRTGRPLPTRVEHLFRICRLSAAEWAEDGEAVMEFFEETPEGFIHGRIEKELQSAQEFIEKKAAAGKASARTRAQQKPNTPSTRVGTHRPTDDPTNGQLESKTTPSPSPSPVVAVAATREVSRETDLTEPEKAEARRICEAFNAELETIYTSQTHLPHTTNFHTAISWAREGLTADFCRPVFVAILTRRAANGELPPTSLSYFAQPLANAKAAANKPMPEGKADDDLTNLPPHLDRKRRSANNFDAAVAAARGIVAG